MYKPSLFPGCEQEKLLHLKGHLSSSRCGIRCSYILFAYHVVERDVGPVQTEGFLAERSIRGSTSPH